MTRVIMLAGHFSTWISYYLRAQLHFINESPLRGMIVVICPAAAARLARFGTLCPVVVLHRKAFAGRIRGREKCLSSPTFYTLQRMMPPVIKAPACMSGSASTYSAASLAALYSDIRAQNQPRTHDPFSINPLFLHDLVKHAALSSRPETSRPHNVQCRIARQLRRYRVPFRAYGI